MNSISMKYHELLLSIIQVLLAENESLRHSMTQVDSLLKHALELLNENECYVNMVLQNKLSTSKVSIYKASGITEIENDKNSLRLNKMLSNATQLFQVDDIVSQIAKNIIERTLVVDNSITKVSNMPVNDLLTPTHEILQESIEEMQHLKNKENYTAIKQMNLNPGDIELFE